jgi:type I restriction enzyme, S subunit
MNAERLLEHYEQIADAPEAVARLRRFILELAVRGKLVPQDPSDEPASELLKRIVKEKARLVKVGEIRRGKGGASELKGPPFELPNNWTWAAFGQIHLLIRGVTYSKSDVSEVPSIGFIPVLRANNIGTTLTHDDPVYVNQSCVSADQLLRAGDFMIALSSGSKNLVGKAAFVPEDYPEAFGGFCGAIRLFDRSLQGIVRVFLHSDLYRESISEGSRGIGINNLKTETLSNLFFPLPPLAEQPRIVAKFDELMSLCDRLAAARAGREEVRDRLAAASLAHVNAPDPATFQVDARFALDALPALTTRPDQIKALRQTILNLAVRGKLVPQDAKDEPASELPKRIAAENKKLMAAKGIRSQMPALPAENFEADHEIPPTWCNVYLQDIAYQITDGTHLTPKYTETGKPFLSAQNVKPFRFMPDRHRFVSEADFDKYRANRRPERGDILMTRVGAGIGEAAVLDSDFEFAFYVSLCLIKIPKRLVSAEYLVPWLNSPEGRESSTIRTYGKGASQGNLNLGLIRTFKVPLPPLTEQHRIVAKVDALMALCDRLEASLTGTAVTRRHLLDVLLAEALAPGRGARTGGGGMTKRNALRSERV